MSDLSDLQQEFSSSIKMFLAYLNNHNYGVSFGEAWRPPEMAAIYAAQGKGIACSLHEERLAIDLNIFDGEKWLETKEELLPLGEIWESYSVPGVTHCWGGRFSEPDSDHFSISYGGRQ